MVINYFKSEKSTLKSDLPQGSVLGPMLFNGNGIDEGIIGSHFKFANGIKFVRCTGTGAELTIDSTIGLTC